MLINFFSLFVSISRERRYNVEQVKAGTMYHLTLEAEDTDHPKFFQREGLGQTLGEFQAFEGI